MLITCNNLPRCLAFRAQFISQAEFIFHLEQEVEHCSLRASAFPIAGKIHLFRADFFMSGMEPLFHLQIRHEPGARVQDGRELLEF